MKSLNLSNIIGFDGREIMQFLKLADVDTKFYFILENIDINTNMVCSSPLGKHRIFY